MEFFFKIIRRIILVVRVNFFRLIGQPPFASRGKGNKVFGWRNIVVGENVSIGDGCWIEAVLRYKKHSYALELVIGSRVSISDYTHISAVQSVVIGDGCLLGSKIYIGDHSHGNTSTDLFEKGIPPGEKNLAEIKPIFIGDNTWICDGVTILAGSWIHNDSIIAANSVVRLITDQPALIAGVPAKIIRYL